MLGDQPKQRRGRDLPAFDHPQVDKSRQHPRGLSDADTGNASDRAQVHFSARPEERGDDSPLGPGNRRLDRMSEIHDGIISNDSRYETNVSHLRCKFAPSVTARLLEAFSNVAERTAPNSPVEALTEREEEVVLTVARGRTNPEIADELHISLSTVKTHLAAVMTKLGAHNRVEIAMWAYETGRMRT